MTGPDPNPPWYTDLRAMAEDDARLVALTDRARRRLCPDLRRRLAGVHVYPSRGCTYTLDKRRVFVSVRDEAGRPLPDCALLHVLLHELAHVANVGGRDHDPGFHRVLDRMRACVSERAGPGGDGDAAPCPERLPLTYNAPCRARGT